MSHNIYEIVRAHTDNLGILAFRPRLTPEHIHSLPIPAFYQAHNEVDKELPVPIFTREHPDSLDVGFLIQVFNDSPESIFTYTDRVVEALGNCAVYPTFFSISEYERQESIFNNDKVIKKANHAA